MTAAESLEGRSAGPSLRPVRLRAAARAPGPSAVSYDSEPYALLSRPREIERHARRVERFLRPDPYDRLLEVGCGRGWLTRRIQERCPATYGVDVNPSSIAHGVAPQLLVMDATALDFEDEQFDHAFSFHTIEHVPDVAAVLRELRRVVVPGGRVLLVYPAEPVRGLYAMPGAWLGYGSPFLARKLHVHKLTPRRVRALGAACGLVHVESALHLLLCPQFLTVLRRPE